MPLSPKPGLLPGLLQMVDRPTGTFWVKEAGGLSYTVIATTETCTCRTWKRNHTCPHITAVDRFCRRNGIVYERPYLCLGCDNRDPARLTCPDCGGRGQMTRGEWKALFDQRYPPLDPEVRQQVWRAFGGQGREPRQAWIEARKQEEGETDAR